MAILAKASGGGDFQLAPQGQFAAVCYEVIDLGTQHNPNYGTNSPKVLIRFELHGENQLGDGSGYMLDMAGQPDPEKPFIIGNKFTVSLSEKSVLRPFLQSWRGRPFTEEELEGFDVSKLLGAACMLTIQHERSQKDATKTFAKIASISPLLKSIQKPQPVNKLRLFEVNPWQQHAFEELPDWMKDIIKLSPEYREATHPLGGEGGGTPMKISNDVPFDDDIPF